MPNVIHVTTIKNNLFSSRAILDKGFIITSYDKKCRFIRYDTVAATGVRHKKINKLQLKTLKRDIVCSAEYI